MTSLQYLLFLITISYYILFSVTLETDILQIQEGGIYKYIKKNVKENKISIYIYIRKKWKMSFRSQSQNEELMFAQK